MHKLLGNIAPLTQSKIETAGCPRGYVAIYVDGKGGGGASVPSERGQEVHHVMSQYVSHCASNRVASDRVSLDRFAAASGPVAGPILDGICDTYCVDWEHVYRTEMTLALDEDFQPAYRITNDDRYCGEIERIPGVAYSEETAAYVGTLDVTLLSDDGRLAKIEDFKTTPSMYEADTPQGKMYAFMLMSHLSDLETVRFELNFCRYTNALRAVSYSRRDLPELRAFISRARKRQRITHERPDEALALPSKVCVYCPMSKDFSCPIAQFNEYTALSLKDRLMWSVWLTQMARLNTPILRQNAEVNGPIRYEDGNGRVYEFGEMPVPSTRYPLDRTTIQILDQHSAATGDEWTKWNLNISSTGLKDKLKAKKRAALREAFEDSIIETGTKPKYAVRTPEGIEDDSEKYREE